MYSIAFRKGLDFKDLAAWNDIGAPYTIYVGQLLRLSPPRRGALRPATENRRGATAAVASPEVLPPGLFENVKTAPAKVVQAVPASPASTRTAAPAPIDVHGAPTVAADVTGTRGGADASGSANTAGGIAWDWPAKGPLVGKYAAHDPTQQGIDIAGNRGDPIRAAAAGTVVYSGNGLIGYGELIIIKHDATYLSAYGHNSKRLVQEGAHIARGQVIAEMGATNASRNALHFEIRKNGKPVDPLDYLPGR